MARPHRADTDDSALQLELIQRVGDRTGVQPIQPVDHRPYVVVHSALSFGVRWLATAFVARDSDLDQLWLRCNWW